MALSLGNSQVNLPTVEVTGSHNSSLFNTPNQVAVAEDVDQLIQLQQFGWQVGNNSFLYFPVTNIQTHIGQDVVSHKYPDLDAARLENTGRNPIVVSCTAIFVNTITPGPKESWKAGTLFPTVYQAVLNSALNRNTGILQHPFIGQFSAKLLECDDSISSDFRGGAILSLHFEETINDDNILNNIQSTVPDVNSSASTLDNTIKSLTPAQLAFLKSQYGGLKLGGYAGIMADISNAIGQGQLAILNILGKISQTLYYVDNLITAIDLANDIVFAQIKNDAIVFYSRLLSFQQKFNAATKKSTSTYVTRTPMSLATIATVINKNLSDLMTLNPRLLGYPVIPANTPIKYYA